MSLIKLLKIPFDNAITIRHYEIKTDVIKNKSVKIALVTDLHSNLYDKKYNKLSALVKEQKPDIIALAGDIADHKRPIDEAIQFINDIQGLAPIYYVTGNHECKSCKRKIITEAFRALNVNILSNSYIEVTINGMHLIIGGVDDPEIVNYEKHEMDWDKEFIESFRELKDKSCFKILLSHRPELVKMYKNSPFDLILSGHAHGGQVRIPYLVNGLFAPNQGIFPKFAGGLYKYANITHIVCRGISDHTWVPRIFNPPELVVIDIF